MEKCKGKIRNSDSEELKYENENERLKSNGVK
jgi:hypothetical protein